MNRTLLAIAMLASLLSLQAARPARADDNKTWDVPVANPAGPIVMRVVMLEDQQEDPEAAGKEAAEALQKAMQGATLKAVIVSECFEDKENKEKVLRGICSVFDPNLVFGAATYGSFTQQGCTDFDSVCLLGIGGDGIGVSAALETEMGTAKLSFDEHEEDIKRLLHAAGGSLGEKLHRTDRDKMLILIPDAHSPKNQFLVEGVQRVVGAEFPMTGGSANKNAGQTYVYFRGQMYQDSAVAVMLSGDFGVAMSGRLAKENAAVIRSAGEGAAEALSKAGSQPLAVLAYNCAGRRSKLTDIEEELAAVQQAIGKTVPLFGCYNAGEIGPLDPSEKQPAALCGGSGWHVMFTVISK